jgi:hypothetical protein
MADVVAQAPSLFIHEDPKDAYMEVSSPKESDGVPTPPDDKPAAVPHVVDDDVDMKDGNSDVVVQAPPSPAPSSDSMKHTPTVRSPSSNAYLPAIVAVNGFSPDHPENSIPSPASPAGEGMELPSETPLPEQQHFPLSSILSPTSSKREPQDDGDTDAMIADEQRPAKRARTADIASVSVFSFRIRRDALGVVFPSTIVDVFFYRLFQLYFSVTSDGASFTCTKLIKCCGLHRAPSMIE